MPVEQTTRSDSVSQAPAQCPYCDRRTTGPFRDAYMRDHIAFCETQWQPIATAPEGQRIRIGHESDVPSMKVDTICPVFGTRTGDLWKLNSYFVVPMPRGAFCSAVATSVPTHWLPRVPEKPTPVNPERTL